MKYIIKVSPEITIKSKFVRKQSIRMLAKNIRAHLKIHLKDFKVNAMWDKIELKTEEKKEIDIRTILEKIPGIEYFLKVKSYKLLEGYKNTEDNSEIFQDILEKTKKFYLDKIENKTFVVRVKRAGEHNFTSIDLERYLGGGLLKFSKNSKVKLKNPNIIVSLEVKDNSFYIIKEKIKGLGGYPVGFQENVLSLISGGFDSGVSTFSMMKRGCKVDYLFFNLGGSAHELGVKQIAFYLWNNFSVSYNAKFITINFEEIISELLTKINHKYRGILLKRYMLKVTSMFKYYYAIVKGDSLGQVSSQTLKNMSVIDKASTSLVLRPLISYNKQEIIDISKKIGTYSFSANMPEYCGVVSDKPATGARLDQILSEEKLIEEIILEKAFENRKIEKIKDILIENMKEEDIEISNFPLEEEIVIDIREVEKIKNNPLKIKGIKIKKIPFFEINYKFKKLDKKKIYLFYCDKGVLSKLHALYLKKNGYNNIKLFRPLKNSISCKKGP